LLILLPIGAFLLTFLHLNGRCARDQGEDSRRALLLAALLLGVVVTVTLELLSLVRGIRQLPLALVWAGWLAVPMILGVRERTLALGWRRAIDDLRRLRRGESLVVALLALLVGLMLVVAWLAPPNNNDSMIYHMSRVVHWAENGSLSHYSTSQDGQISKPLWSETAILTLRVLFGSDRPANLVQWSAMVLSLVGVSAVAQLLGASRLGQIVASAFAASIPLGVLHSTNTKNDYAVALWMVCLVYLVLTGKRRRLSVWETGLVGAGVGLGLLTKGTTFPYVFPILVWYLAVLVRSGGFRRMAAQAAGVAVVAAALNLGLWARNLSTYGGLYGAPGGLSGVVETDALGQEPGPAPAMPAQDGPEEGGADANGGLLQGLWSRVEWLAIRTAKNAAQNVVIPEAGGPLRQGLYAFPGLFDREFVDSLEEGMWNHEDTAGNLIHLLLFVAALPVLIFGAVRRRDWTAVEVALVVSAGFVGLALITYSVELFGIRYQLPFFVLAAPVVGLALSWIGRPGITLGAAFFLVLAAVPYVLLNNTRPLVGTRPRTRVESVLRAPAADLLFAHVPEQKDAYLAAADTIRASSCRAVGLDIPPSQLEYLIWWVLDAPQSGIRIETLSSSPLLERYLDPSFRPCAVICASCAGQAQWGGLPLRQDFGYFRLYAVVTAPSG